MALCINFTCSVCGKQTYSVAGIRNNEYVCGECVVKDKAQKRTIELNGLKALSVEKKAFKIGI